MRDLKQIYTNKDYATMQEKVVWRKNDINTKMARIHVMVNNYVQDHVGTDITNRTNNATNIMYDSPPRRGPLL